MNRNEALGAVFAAPLDPVTHENLGDTYRAAAAHWPAQACYRSALFLGSSDPGVLLKLVISQLNLGQIEAANKILVSLGELTGPLAADRDALLKHATTMPAASLATLDHNRFYRLRSLAREIRTVAGAEPCSVLDIGGGDGVLAAFLPDDDYLLVEPGTNGLSGLALPLEPDSVDVVCACHVLEHIPPGQRDQFLDQLLATARNHVILLNPFAAKDGKDQELLQLTADVTGAGWAHEHLECGLPELEVVRDYALRRGLAVSLRPNGAVGTAIALVMMDHFAELAGRQAEAQKINAYFNSLNEELLVSPALPAAWLVHFDLKSKNSSVSP
ncbi:MAG: class I SAM-dependent methyltransferase [Candidatus Krumholzibacteria bacterium]|nr:class I SAM-dependent methyltransferase [Candidatus Krumholzibacteria bacterium]